MVQKIGFHSKSPGPNFPVEFGHFDPKNIWAGIIREGLFLIMSMVCFGIFEKKMNILTMIASYDPSVIMLFSCETIC